MVGRVRNDGAKRLLAALALCGLSASPLAHAIEPNSYVFVPGVTAGEREIDFKSGSWKRGGERESAASLGFGYGVNQHWFTEVYGKYKNEAGQGTFFDAVEWENKFQLTEPGQYFVDLGFIIEIERPRDRSEGYEVLFGPLFQKDFGKTQANFNLLFQRNYRADEPNAMRAGYQWQLKYRWRRQFEFGLQGFGDTGFWNQMAPRSQQTHLLGPAVFGRLSLGGRKGLYYNAGWLFDVGDERHTNWLRTQIEYEF